MRDKLEHQQIPYLALDVALNALQMIRAGCSAAPLFKFPRLLGARTVFVAFRLISPTCELIVSPRDLQVRA